MRQNAQKKISQLRDLLTELKQNHAVIGLKGGTETEDMDFDEIHALHLVAQSVLPVTIKIGGPEARNDIRSCIEEEIEGIAAPMIESEYALRNFVSTLKSLIPPVSYPNVIKSINLETITGYRNLLEIVDSESFGEIQSVTAARSDLSASMGLEPDDPEITRISRQIVKIAREKGKKSSVGGTISINNYEMIVNEIEPDKINSRHVVVDALKKKSSALVVEAMLSFEIELFDLLAMVKPQKAFFYKNRIEINRERIGKKRVVYSIR